MMVHVYMYMLLLLSLLLLGPARHGATPRREGAEGEGSAIIVNTMLNIMIIIWNVNII